MELDLRLQRSADQSWGFRLIGGTDFSMPLTVVKVIPNSPAEKAGLQNGDTVTGISSEDASSMSHEDSRRAVAAAGLVLELKIVRGLYDMVLDDTEPLYEEIDQQDFDQPSQPTEVPDYYDLTFTLPEFTDIRPLPDLVDIEKLVTDNNGVVKDSNNERGNTESPFVPNLKPYRPFSTEPITEVPPLEDPIILNPNYKDIFDFRDDEECLPATRFKLPISEQYDPEYAKEKKKDNTDVIFQKGKDVFKGEVTIQENKDVFEKDVKEKTAVSFKEVTEVIENVKEEIMTVDEVQFLEKMKTEIDLEKIELTASSIVDESIEKAVTVAEEIKKEIDVELRESAERECVKKTAFECTEVKATAISETEKTKESKFESKDVTEQVEFIEKQAIKQDINTTEENLAKVELTEANVQETKQRNISKKETEQIDVSDDVENKRVTEDSVKSQRRETTVNEEKYTTDRKDTSENVTKTVTETKTDKKYSTAKLLAEQRAYALGLQTIPSLRGTAHSSYHYNLLLKTFFIHLTDVMVALSRFILAEPVLSKPLEREVKTKEGTVRDEVIKQKSATSTIVDERKDASRMKQEAAKVEQVEKKTKAVARTEQKEKAERQVEKEDTIVTQREDRRYVAEYNETEEEENRVRELIERRSLSGSRMAQLVEKKPEELMQKMEAVITEFESKSAGEDVEVVRERRSRSHSRMEEPLEQSKRTEAVAEVSSSAMSSSYSESMTSKRTESRYECNDEIVKSKDGKNTYLAIVEAHVYTNKDAIFDEQLALSEASSVKREEVALAREVIQAAAEKIAFENVEVKQAIETAKVTDKVTDNKVEIVERKAAKSTEFIEDSKQTKIIEKSAQDVRKVDPIVTKVDKAEVVKQKVEKTSELIEEKKEVQKVVAKDIKAVAKEEKVMIQEIVEPITEAQATVINGYYVTEVKDEVSNDAKVSAKHETTIQEIIDIKDESISLKKEAISVKEDKVSHREESLTQQKDVSIKDTAVSVKKEAISVTEDKTSLKEQKSSIIESSLTEQSVKEEVAVKKEQKKFTKAELVSAAHRETAKRLSESMQQETTLVKDTKEVAESVKEDIISLKEIKEDMIALKEKTEERQAIETAILEQKVAEIAKVKEVVVAKDVKEQRKEVTDIKENAIKEVAVKHDEDESAQLKISKEQIVDVSKTTVQLEEDVDIHIKNVEISESKFESNFESVDQQSTFIARSVEKDTKQIDQESTFVAKIVEKDTTQIKQSLITKSVEKTSVASIEKEKEKLTLNTEIAKTKEVTEEKIETPSPYVPPTPLTDEYIFKLEIPLPKRQGPDIPRDCTPSDDDEDPHIVKKGLIPHAETEIEEQKIFDPPLPTPPVTPGSVTSPKSGTPTSPKSPTSPRSPKFPVYTKPGLRGGADRDYSMEEILEIERKSSLLASAIDQTIKSIEEYKEEVGIQRQDSDHSSNGVIYNGYAKVVETKIFDSPVEEKEVFNHSEASIEKNDTKTIEVSQDNNITQVVIEKPKEITNGNINIDLFVSNNSFIETHGQKTDTKYNDEIKATIFNTEKVTPDNEVRITNGDVESVKENIDAKIKAVEEDLTKTAQNIDVKIKAAEVSPQVEIKREEDEKRDAMEGYRPVHFDPEELLNAQRERRALGVQIPQMTASQERELYKTESGDLIGTNQGIVDGLEEAVVDTDAAKELGKPGITDEKIAALISGEAEMLREAHVMGLSRVLKAHMIRDDDSSVDFKKIKPIVESLKDSEVLKALNEEFMKTQEEKKKEERKWTTFLQKPKRPVPRGKAKFGCQGAELEEEKGEPYKVKIVKQPKPKVAPDYKPKDFNTGLLPWEERALREPTPPPVAPEDPILIPEEPPEVLEAVDPLPESEVPDLEDSGIPLPPPEEPSPPTPPPEDPQEEEVELDLEAVIEETEQIVEESIIEEMDRGNVADQLMASVQNMVDPNAPLDQQLAQMRAQLAALAQLPGVIQQSLEMVTRQLSQLSQLEAQQQSQPAIEEAPAEVENAAEREPLVADDDNEAQNGVTIEEMEPTFNQAANHHSEEPSDPAPQTLSPEEVERMKKEEEEMLEEQRRMEKQKKELMEEARLEHESRQIKQRPTPRVGKPKPVFGPATPQERPLVLPGGRKWRKPQDAFNEAIFTETLQAQAEIIAGKAKGFSYESVLLPYDERINFMKYEKPPVSLDHLKDSDVYKMVHGMEQPGKRVEMLTPVLAEQDYREKCRSMTPCPQRLAQQVQP